MKSKPAVIFLVVFFVLIAAGVFYYFVNQTVSADVLSKQTGIKPKLISGQELTLREISKDKYEIVQPIAISSGFGIQMSYPNGLVPAGTVKWARDAGTGVILLDKTYKKVAIYPITAGDHLITCKIGTQDITISFSDKGAVAATVTPTATITASKSKTVRPSATATVSATASKTHTATSTATVNLPPAP